MTRRTPIHPSDLLGLSRLAVDATAGVADLVEATHAAIAETRGILDRPAQRRTNGTPGLAYETVHAVTRLVGRRKR